MWRVRREREPRHVKQPGRRVPGCLLTEYRSDAKNEGAQVLNMWSVCGMCMARMRVAEYLRTVILKDRVTPSINWSCCQLLLTVQSGHNTVANCC